MPPKPPAKPARPSWAKPQQGWTPLLIAPFRAAEGDSDFETASSFSRWARAGEPNEEYELNWKLGRVSILKRKSPRERRGWSGHPLSLLDDLADELARETVPSHHALLAARWNFLSWLWRDLCDAFQAKAISGVMKVAARPGSPLAEFTIIPGDVWRHFAVEDWRRGVAGGPNGERLFSVYVLPGEGPPEVTDADRAIQKAETMTRGRASVFAWLDAQHSRARPKGSRAFLANRFAAWLAKMPEEERRKRGWKPLSDVSVKKYTDAYYDGRPETS